MHLLVKCRSLALAFITLIAVHAVPLPANVPAATSVTQAAPPGPHPAVGSTTSSLTLHNSPQAVQSEEEIPRWISRKPLDQEEVTSTEKNVFKTTLTGITLGKRLPVKGANNRGIYPIIGTYKAPDGSEHKGDSILLKVSSVKAPDWSEVKALHIIGDLVASGKLKDSKFDSNEEMPVIIFKKYPGQFFTESKVYMDASPSDKIKMGESFLEKMCEEVAKVATTKHLYHSDNHPENVLVTFKDNNLDSLNLIDWGSRYVYQVVDKTVTKDKVYNWCLKRSSNFFSTAPLTMTSAGSSQCIPVVPRGPCATKFSIS